MSARFSQKAVLAYAARRAAHFAEGFRAASGTPIDPGDGWAQCDGKPVQAAIAYGHWKALQDLVIAMAAGEVRS